MTKVNSTVALTLILLSLMVAAGIVSAAWGYALGREALRGITQPDVRPTSTLGDATGVPRREEVPILREADIIADVKARMQGKSRGEGPSPSASAVQAPSLTSSPAPAATSATTAATGNVNSVAGLPIVSENQGVILEVQSVRQQEGALILDVNLRNRSSQPHKFLYSFMNVTDNQGRSFTANTAGLPGELPPTGETFSGTVSIPIALLDGSDTLSLSLTDYPKQQLQLQLSGIPVVR